MKCPPRLALKLVVHQKVDLVDPTIKAPHLVWNKKKQKKNKRKTTATRKRNSIGSTRFAWKIRSALNRNGDHWIKMRAVPVGIFTEFFNKDFFFLKSVATLDPGFHRIRIRKKNEGKTEERWGRPSMTSHPGSQWMNGGWQTKWKKKKTKPKIKKKKRNREKNPAGSRWQPRYGRQNRVRSPRIQVEVEVLAGADSDSLRWVSAAKK